MTITVKQLSKRYNYQVIFKNIDYIFETGKSYAILGPNGSGKSTLLKVLSGFLTPSKGIIQYAIANATVENSEVYRQINYAAPYIQLIEDFTLDELLQFHFTFKSLIDGLEINDLKKILQLKKIKHKYIKDFSSGMKQRVKLVLALLTQSTIILLDEPTTNLDDAGVNWYHQLIQNYLEKRLIIVASNRIEEYSFCEERLEIMGYK